MLTGGDFSIWQHPPDHPEIDYKLAVKKGIDFAIVQYRDEDAGENPYFLKDHSGFKSAGARTGSYVFLRPDLPLAPQAEDLRMLAKYGPVWGDLEVTGGKNAADLRAWWEQLTDSAPHIGIVTYPAFIEAYGPFANTSPLWIDSFGAPHAPAGALLWGMTDKAQVPGIPGVVDLDGFTGTRAQFDALFPNAIARVTIAGVTFTPTSVLFPRAGVTLWGIPGPKIAHELEKKHARIVHNPGFPAGPGLYVEEEA